MAGASYPKPDAEKVSRNPLEFGWTALPLAGNPEQAPKLASRAPGGGVWLKGTRDWWARLWASPQSTQWQCDDGSLFRLAAIQDRHLRGTATVGELNEMRQIEDRHGLNPKAMLQLRWRIVDVAESAEPKARGKARKQYGHLAPVNDAG
jgi:hypothetical protein